MRETRFDIAKRDIISLLEKSDTKVYSFAQLSELFDKNRAFWRLPVRLSANKFIDLLLTKTKLTKHDFGFSFGPTSRYTWGDVSIFTLVSTLKANAYFSHYSAVYLHGLTEQIPRTIYLNFEQSIKPAPKGKLIQENIDRAFSRPQRISQNIAMLNDYKICLLSGKNTGNLGVVEIRNEDNKMINVTNIERTLIDITVRPVYSGGIYEVLNAFKKAKGKFSVNKLLAMLKQIGYVYPYHQVIGFYMERAGYQEPQLHLVRKIEMKYDFYLDYGMKETDYSKEWRLYFPKNF